jgi:hypothetical protein
MQPGWTYFITSWERETAGMGAQSGSAQPTYFVGTTCKNIIDILNGKLIIVTKLC